MIDRFVKTESAEAVYDTMLIPALNYAERDRIEERLLPHEETAVTDTTRELLDLLSETQVSPADREPSLRVLGYAVNGRPDELALRMLGQLVRGLPLTLDITQRTPVAGGPRRVWYDPNSTAPSASPICRRARRPRAAIWSRSFARRFLSCVSSLDDGRTRIWRTRHCNR